MLHPGSQLSICRRAAGRSVVALGILLGLDIALAQQQQPTIPPGANVNVVSGTGADGDWTLQRQNEPSMACSSRNPRNCLAGANDYRTVDIPFPNIGEKITGDAWLGWYTTKDGGLTWRTRLVPGYPQDTSAAGAVSPLRGYAAGADPVVRPGTNGLFYYAGLVFNREEGAGSAIFVARFIDNNNQEGTAGEPIDYLGASIVQRTGPTPVVAQRGQRGAAAPAVASRRPGREPERRIEPRDRREPEGRGEQRKTGERVRARAGAEQEAEQLVDKPWIAVDVPRAGAQMCTIGGGSSGVPLQTFPGGRVYIAYALFDGPGETRSRIMFSSSADCGQTWATPRAISRVPSGDVNDDGLATTADLTRLQASFGRSCGQTGYNPNADVNNDCRVDVLDLAYVSKTVGQPVPAQPRLSQGATLAIDPLSGALQIAWRQFGDGVSPDAVVTVRSTNGGLAMSAPRVVAPVVPFDQGDSNTSFRSNGYPTMAIDGTGRVYLAWTSRGFASQRPNPLEDDARVVMSTALNGATWSTPQPVDLPDHPGHQIMPALAFAQGKLQLIYYDLREDVSQLFGPFVDELPILTGPPPRVRHTIDVRAAQADPGPTPTFTSFRLTQYQFGGVPGSQTLQQLEFNPPNLPLFRAGTTPFMGDYVDVTPEAPFVRNGSSWAFNTAPTGSPVFHGVWTDNRDIRPPANGVWTDYTPPNPPFPRPAMSLFDPSQPVPVCVPGQAGMRNQNIYTARITRGLVVGALGNSRRLGAIQRSFPVFAQNNTTAIRSYRLTINNQPVGGQASFRQFDLLTTLDVEVPRKSTVARTVFVRSSDPRAQVSVSVVEIAAPNGAVVPNGQAGTIVLNPDPTNPDLENPDLENPDLENPDLENAEVQNPDLENAIVRNPDLENPDLENPDLENPDLENARVANPSILNPDLENPDLENPDLENPDLENPDLENADLVNGALSDTTWTVTNRGNTAASFTVKLGLNRDLPAGFRSQLIAHKIYQTPTVLGCALLKQTQTVLLANIPNPRYVPLDFANPDLENPDLENPDLENLTVALAPGETARITLRVFDPNRFDTVAFRAADNVTPVAVAQAVGTIEAQQGITQPIVSAPLASAAPVPGTTTGGPYTTTLTSPIPGTWTVAGGTVPPGVTVQENGVVTGTPTTPGTYTFTARFQSQTGVTDYRTVTITVGGPGAAADLSVTSLATADPLPIGGEILYTIRASNAGPSAATNVVVTDTLPEATTFLSAVPTQGSCRFANGTVVCTLGGLSNGAFATIQLRVLTRATGPHLNQAVVSSVEPDPVASNNTASTSTGSVPLAPCTTVCFSGPTGFSAGPAEGVFRIDNADFNEDGALDLVYSQATGQAISVLLGNGAGGFGPPTLITTPHIPQGAVVGDFNNDGNIDIVSAHANGTQAALFLGNGAGGFGSASVIDVGFATFGVVAGDFNEDGNADLVFGGSAAATTALVLVRGNGNGTFLAPVPFVVGAGAHSVVADDFNGDGNLDIASANRAAATLTILLGSGSGSFPSVTTVPFANISRVRNAGDLTGDGIVDLLVNDTPDGTNQRLLLLRGTGGGAFAAPVDLNAAPSVAYTTPGDLDGDGDMDLTSTHTRGGVSFQLNDGTGQFAAPVLLPAPPTSHVVVADFNGDQRMDIAVSAGGSAPSQVLVFLNTCDAPPAELSIVVEDSPDPAVEGGTIGYAITVANNGPNAATAVQVTHVFGANAVLVSATSSQGSCTANRNIVTCQLGTLAMGGTATVDVQVTPMAGIVLPAISGVSAATSDPVPGNNAVFTQTTVTPGASTFVVTNTNDFGPGSFRAALNHANSDAGPVDTITFNIPGAGPHTIRPTVLPDLPVITQPVVIDGTTQPGYSGQPLIELSGENADVVNGLTITGSNSIVRGLAINRFGLSGIAVTNPAGANNTFHSNVIGADPTGTVALPNGSTGILIRSAGNAIGGDGAATGNVISGNAGAGIVIDGVAATGNVVVRNRIGSDVTGSLPLGNGADGVHVTNGASNNRIGLLETGVGNTIASNGQVGVRVSSGTGNAVVNNEIFSNGSLGIDLGPTGVTANDAGDTDTGANNLINFPTFASATRSSGNVRVLGTLSPSPLAPYQVHFYSSPACDPSGNGEGRTRGSVLTGFTQNTGDTSIDTTIGDIAAGMFITATVTDAGGNTSEFSTCVQVVDGISSANLSVGIVDAPDPVAAGGALTYTITVSNLGPDAASAVTLQDVLPAGVTLVSVTPAQGSCSGTTTVTCELGGIAQGTSTTVEIVVTPTAAGTLSNSASAASPEADDVPGNNTATAITTVTGGGPATFEVTNTNDSGAGSLRQAITTANANPGLDLITFAIPGTGIHTIELASPLPVITGSLTIDGTSQPGWTGLPVIELDGTNAGTTANGLVVNGNSSTIQALAINRFGAGGAPTEAGGNGIVLQGAGDHRIWMLHVGIDPTGTIARGNRADGILVDNSPNNRIGGTSPFRNVLSGNGRSGLALIGSDTIGTLVASNVIGTNREATTSIGNGYGVLIQAASSNTIGDPIGDMNVISGNTLDGVAILGEGATLNVISHNIIGTNESGTNSIGNRNGIEIDNDAHGNLIGGAGVAQQNVIAFNDLNGVVVRSGFGNTILSNNIRQNGLLGIDLGPEGVTPNDDGDVDDGANTLVNFPILTLAESNGSGILNTGGLLSSAPGAAFTIQIFHNVACDSSLHGEGGTLIATLTNVQTDSSGIAVFSHSGSQIVAPGQGLSATATDDSGNTSEFAACVVVTSILQGAELQLQTNDSPDPVAVGNALTYTLSVTNNGPETATNVTLTDVLPAGIALVSATSTAGVCSGTSTVVCALNPIADGVTVTATIVVTPTVAGTIFNQASVSAAETDQVPGNNTAQSETIVVGAPSSFVVTNTNPAGAGSLREAILGANANIGPDTITFNIPGAGVRSIFAVGLPAVTDPVAIDGTTQPGYSGTPLIELNGSESAPGMNGLVINGGGSLVRALLINRFPGSGLVVNSDSNSVDANWIGVAPSGNVNAANGTGITITGSGNLVGNGTVAARNVISGNTGAGVDISVAAALGNAIVGNLIGTNVAGTASLPNNVGIRIVGEANAVGGAVGTRNVISGNSLAGVLLIGGANSNTIAGNYIGTGLDGPPTSIPNGTGIRIDNASSNLIGGPVLESGNIIAFNGVGIVVANGGTNNAIFRNAIFANGALGIDLNDDGPTSNDIGDTDEGANERQNFPVLTAASGGVQGTLSSFPDSLFRIEFFGSAVCDASNHGEGETFLGSVDIQTEGDGTGTIPFFAVPAGQFVTATATDSSNNTSEFSTCVQPATNARTWISNASGVWEDPANWSDGIVPANGDVVVIDRGAANPVVTIQSATVTLAALRSEEPLVMTGGAITLTGTADINAGITMSGGLLTGTGNIQLGGFSLWTSGNINGSGGLNVLPTGQLSVQSPGQNGLLERALTNNGLLMWNQATLSFIGNGTLTNQAGGFFEVQSNMLFVNNGSGDASVINHGVMVRSGPAGALQFDDTGFVTTGVLQLRLGPTPDRIVSNVTASLGGLLDVVLQPGFVPTVGQQFDILAFGTRNGTFATINSNGQNYEPTYSPTGLVLTAQAVAIAELSLTKSDAPDPVTQGAPLTYTVTITNNGPEAAADVALSDGLPDSVTFVSATPTQGSCTGTAFVICSLGTLANGASATVTIVVTPNTLGPIANTAIVTSATQDDNPSNNFATTTTTVLAPAGTFVVTTTANSGAGSLRQAILDANASVNTLDNIQFNIPGAGAHTISLTGFLPTITDPVIIDGTTQPGTSDLPLIQLDGVNAGPFSNGLFLAAGSSTVRGLSITRFGTGGQPADNGGAGIVIQGAGNNVIERNLIGIAANGTTAAPNRADGVFVDNSPNNRIGGSLTVRNVLSGNGRYGVMLNGDETVGTLVAGNLIGPSATETAPTGTPQFGGIAIFGGVDSLIGGDEFLTGNVIAFNSTNGIHVASGTGNTIRRNRISANGALGINLGAAGVTANDPGDGDTGANGLLNFPVLTAAPGGVSATFNGAPNAAYTIEFFLSPGCDASGNGEGSIFLMALQLETDLVGNAATIGTVPVPPDQRVTATATDTDGNTSEFSNCVFVSPSIVLSLPTAAPIGVDRSVMALVTLTTPAPSGGVVVDVTSDAPTVAAVASPGSVTIAEGASAAQIQVTGVSAGDTTLRATADGYQQGTLGVTVTQNLISSPAQLSVALGQSADLPISIGPSPAPPGGLLLNVTSANPSIVEVVTPQVTVPAGALSVNATVRGLVGGGATITISNPEYSPSTTDVTISAELNVLVPSTIFNAGLPAETLTVRLEHNGTPVAAQSTLQISLAASNTGCVSVPATITIGAGLVTSTFQPSYGGSAALPCTTTVSVSSPGLTSDTVEITVNPPASLSGAAGQIGAGLQAIIGASIDTSSHGGLNVTIQSPDPSRLLVSPNATTPGAESIVVNLPLGQTSFNYFVQAIAGTTGSVDLSLSATGVNTGTQTVQIMTPGIEIANIATETTSLSTDDTNWYVQVGLPCPGNGVICNVQAVRVGGPPLVVTLALSPAQTPIAQIKSDEPVAVGQTVTKPIQPGFYHSTTLGATLFGLALDPLGVGTTTMTVSAAGFVPAATGVRVITITGPGFTTPGSLTLGAGLQSLQFAGLTAAQHGGVTVTVASDNPARVLVSPNVSTPGSTSFNVVVPNGQTSVSYVVQGLENVTGTANITLSAPGFTSATHSVQVVPPGIEIVNLITETTTLSGDDTGWYAQVGLPCPGNTIVCSAQHVRAGSPGFIVTLSLTPAVPGIAQLRSDEPVAVGQSVTKPIQSGIHHTQAIAVGTSFGLALRPLGNGSATVTVTGPPGVLTMTSSGTRTVTITGPTISSPGGVNVGAGLQTPSAAFLSAAQHGGITVTVTSSDPSRVLVSPGPLVAGAASINVPVLNGQSTVNYYVQALENVTGAATVTLSATGWTSGAHTVTAIPTGIEIVNLPVETTNLSPEHADWWVQVGLPCPGNTHLCVVQNVRAGGPGILATLTNSNSVVARLRSDEPAAVGQVVTKPIQPGIYFTQAIAGGTSWGLAFDQLSNGATTVTVAGPAGVITMNSGVVNVTVTTPTFLLTNPTPLIGAGLQLAASAFLTGSQHGGVTVTATSSAPSIVRVATDFTTPGQGSILIPIANNATQVPLVVQGMENVTGTATVTLSAPGFSSATLTVTVTESGIELLGLPDSVSAGAADVTSWYVQVGIPSVDHTFLTQVQGVRAGSPGFIITFTNSLATVAQLKSDEPVAVGQVVTKPIQPGIYFTQHVPFGIPYGLAFDPLSPGSTTITATGPPGVITTSRAIKTVVVNP
jgi:uncharacterized repeat protein (TIGR01451 family)